MASCYNTVCIIIVRTHIIIPHTFGVNGRMETTMFPWNAPAALQGIFVLYMGTVLFSFMWRIFNPAWTIASSNEKEQPITNVTKSFRQYSDISWTSFSNTPSLYIRYLGQSLLTSTSLSNLYTPGSRTWIKGQGLGFLWQNKRKSNAYSWGKMHKFAWACPAAYNRRRIWNKS